MKLFLYVNKESIFGYKTEKKNLKEEINLTRRFSFTYDVC